MYVDYENFEDAEGAYLNYEGLASSMTLSRKQLFHIKCEDNQGLNLEPLFSDGLRAKFMVVVIDFTVHPMLKLMSLDLILLSNLLINGGLDLGLIISFIS